MHQRPSDGYLAAWTRLASCYAEDRFDDALVLARKMRTDFPERTAAVAHAEAGLLSATGRADEAIGVLHDLVDVGRWWSPSQLADPDLAALATRTTYRGLATTMLERAQDALVAGRAVQPVIGVETPDGPIRSSVVALHMMGVSGAETATIWAPVTGAGIAVITVESALRNGDGQPCWDDPDLAVRDVQGGVDVARRLGVPVVLAGGSQGAGVAARIALGGEVGDLVGFVCVVGGPSTGTWRAEVSLPGVLVIGGNDHLTAQTQREFHAELLAAGSSVELLDVPDLDHAYPVDWGDLAPGLLGRLSARR